MDDTIAEVPLIAHNGPEFDDVLTHRGHGRLVREHTTTLQINLGRMCNQACDHCHVDAGPTAREIMNADSAARTLQVLAASTGITTVDITGGAPELNPNFRVIVAGARRLGCDVIDRCNLTVLSERGMEQVPEFLAKHHVEIRASLPCYSEENVDKQRGLGTFNKSVHAIRQLNALGYGMPGSTLQLGLVYNPPGAFLPTSQDQLEADYRRQLRDRHGIEFNRLFTITNMPIGRFANFLYVTGKLEAYMKLLVDSFNPDTQPILMCRSLVSVGWDGRLYDCDFNQVLGITNGTRGESIWDVTSFNELDERRIVTGRHCFGCTAGSGSSCGGSLQ
jgi:radical SAM/Cys-rich protein